MIKKILKKIAVIAGLFAVTAGVAFAAFTITQNISSGNKVIAAGAGITVTATPIDVSGLTVGGSTAPNNFTIKNTGSYAGTVKVNLTNVVGALCPDLTLTVSGGATGAFNPMANGSISLGTLNPGDTLSLTQVVSLSATSTQLGQSCIWNETATISN